MPHSHLTGGRPPNPRLLSPTQLSELIDATGLGQTQLAKALGVTTRTVRYWQTGKVSPPKMAVMLLKIIVAQRQKQKGAA